MSCKYCKNKEQTKDHCAYCGTVFKTVEANFIFGITAKEVAMCELTMTERYLIIRTIGTGEVLTSGMAFGAFGILGEAIAQKAMKDKGTYGFYDLRDFAKVIYPYKCIGIKKNTAIKFINRDGTDFIINFNRSGMFVDMAAKVAQDLVSLGIYVENGEPYTFNECCSRPYLNAETIDRYISPSAASFVKVEGGNNARVPLPQQPYANAQPVMNAGAVQNMPPVLYCEHCGAALVSGRRFCGMCGNPVK